MLEECFKCVEGPVTRRFARARMSLPPGSVYSSTNRAFEPGVSAAVEVLALDTLVVEDSVAHSRSICRIPADYEKFFNAVSIQGADAVMQARGVPPDVRWFFMSAFDKFGVQVHTRWGPSPRITLTRGLPQGAVSAPDLSKAAQDPILRLREASPAAYTTVGGRRVATTGYVDDSEHYGRGAADLSPVLGELSLGSRGTGIGFSWGKFSALATDWEEHLARHAPEDMTYDGIAATGWDIWEGGLITQTLPRSFPTSEEVLLGKIVSYNDRHAAAAADLLRRLRTTRMDVQARGCTWDEAAMIYQLKVRGFLSYSALIGIPSPLGLHEEDAAFQRLILARLGTRCTAERVSLLASANVGGLQLPSIVESVVSAVAHDVLALLNGNGLAAQIARDSLREALLRPAADLSVETYGLVSRAFHFLSQYGLYINVGTDRTVGRILDNLRQARGGGQLCMVGAYQPAQARSAASFCRVGPLANSVRAAVVEMERLAIPRGRWGEELVWTDVLDGAAPVTAAECATAAAQALAQSSADWETERRLFGVRERGEEREDWPARSWECPMMVTSRVRLLAAPVPDGLEGDVGLYSDGGQDHETCTFSAQARSFGPPGCYWDFSAASGHRHCGRLPGRYGHEAAGIHAAELLGMLVALRRRRRGQWNLLVCDRSALFSALRRASEGAHQDWRHHYLESTLLHIWKDLEAAWVSSQHPPSWRVDMTENPETWLQRGTQQGRTVTLCRVAFCAAGLVGVDIKSHQQQDLKPYPVVAQGNAAQDAGCRRARALHRPEDVFVPTGGLFAFASFQGRAVTSPVREAVRGLLREEAAHQWRNRPVQGKLARLGNAVYLPCLHPRLYTAVRVEPRWRSLALPTDTETVDISGFVHRCLRAIGGGLFLRGPRGEEPLHDVEEYAVLRQLRGAHAEAATRASVARSIRLPLRISSLVFLGLRRVRAEYLQRARACLDLMQLQLPALERDEAPEALEVQALEPRRGAHLLAEWLDGRGEPTVRQLRWQALQPSAAVARVRAEMPGRLPGEATILEALHSRGVSAREHDILGWGPQCPHFPDLLRILQAGPCVCRQVDIMAFCWDCGRVALGDPGQAILPCRWCRRHVAGEEACRSCKRALHFRGQCLLWGQGAHQAYRAVMDTPLWLCPDCLWALSCQVAASPRRGPIQVPNQDLHSFLERAAERCCPGAGAAMSRPRVQHAPFGLRRARRWALRRITSSGNLSLVALTEAFCQHLQSAGEALAQDGHATADLLDRALNLLLREQLVVGDPSCYRLAV